MSLKAPFSCNQIIISNAQIISKIMIGDNFSNAAIFHSLRCINYFKTRIKDILMHFQYYYKRKNVIQTYTAAENTGA